MLRFKIASIIFTAMAVLIILAVFALQEVQSPTRGIIVDKKGSSVLVEEYDGDLTRYPVSPRLAESCEKFEAWPDCLPRF